MGKKINKKSLKGEGVRTRAKFRSSPEWKDWRIQVIERDEYRCKCCGRKYPSRSLQCHHKNMDKEQYQILDNLDDFVSLCSVCHKAVHQFEIKVRSKKQAFNGNSALSDLVKCFFI